MKQVSNKPGCIPLRLRILQIGYLQRQRPIGPICVTFHSMIAYKHTEEHRNRSFQSQSSVVPHGCGTKIFTLREEHISEGFQRKLATEVINFGKITEVRTLGY
jgi:hypothetical protein